MPTTPLQGTLQTPLQTPRPRTLQRSRASRALTLTRTLTPTPTLTLTLTRCDRYVRIYQAGFSERPRDAARARRAQLREKLSLRSDLEQSRRHIVEHRYDGE